jgi:ankyrin repeat protein
LHYAASGSEPRVVEYLLAMGAQVDAVSPNGSTPLMMAARYGEEGSVKALLARQASRTHRNARGQNAADFARLAGRDWLAGQIEPAGR